MLYMLDTNMCIYLVTGRPPQVLARLESQLEGAVVMSVITYAELCAGVRGGSRHPERDAQVLARLAQRIPVLPFEQAAAERYGWLRAAVPGRRRHALDRLIAAHAVSVGATLVTNNTADFVDYPGLVVENWAESAGVSEPSTRRYAPRAAARRTQRARRRTSAGS
jgi:tRNA(fMet)-specific endonuclease VapC